MRAHGVCAGMGVGLLVVLAAACARETGFDYYLLSLSWSPEFCAHARADGSRDGDGAQCGRPYGFVAHGLWPQYEHGHPQDCAARGRVSEATIERMLPIMPSRGLVIHEWRAHGACSGLDAEAYFDRVASAFRGLRIPADFQAPSQPRSVTPAALKQAFVDANPGLPPAALAVECSAGELRELRVCLTTALKPRDCGRDVRDGCGGGELRVRPVR